MTEREMIQRLEEARQFSETNNATVIAMGNGENIVWFKEGETFKECNLAGKTMKETFEFIGYWVVSIFENGHRVEA